MHRHGATSRQVSVFGSCEGRRWLKGIEWGLINHCGDKKKMYIEEGNTIVNVITMSHLTIFLF